MNGGAFSGGTDLIVWVEPSLPRPEAVVCGERPTFVDPCQYLHTTAFDEAANGETPVFHFVVTEIATRLRVGTEVPVVEPFGFVDLENRDSAGLPLRAVRRDSAAALGDAGVERLRPVQPRLH